MKKHIGPLCIAIALVMLLSACGGTSGAADVSGDSSGGGNVSAAPPSEIGDISTDVVDGDLTCTIALGNWPPDTAPAAELALYEGYKAAMANQYPNVTVVPAYFSYTLSNYVGMAKGGTAPNIFQPPFTDPQLLISQDLAADVTDALEQFGLLEKFSPAFMELLGDENGRIYGLPRDGYVLGMHININLFEEAGLIDENGLPMVPKTLQELAETGKIIREKTGKAGLVFPASETYGGWLFTNIAWNFGCVGANALEREENGRWICNFTSDAAVAAMEYIKSLRWEYDILNADATTTDWAGAHSALGTGEAAMNFAADDSVAEPTAGKGLAVDKFALVPFPAGPAGSYALKGGTCFMFSPSTTTDQAVAALGFLRIAGVLPFVDDDIIAGMRAGAAAKRDRGAPVLPPVPAWNDAEFIAKQQEIADEYSNVDMRLYQDFFDTLTDGSITLKGEEPVFAQQLYRELTAVVQRVITKEDADVYAYLERAQNSFQEYLDEEYGS